MKVTYDPTKMQPPPLGGFTLAVWRGPSFRFDGAGEYEIPAGLEQHPDWEGLIESGAITPVVAPTLTKAKSTSRSKNPPDPT